MVMDNLTLLLALYIFCVCVHIYVYKCIISKKFLKINSQEVKEEPLQHGCLLSFHRRCLPAPSCPGVPAPATRQTTGLCLVVSEWLSLTVYYLMIALFTQGENISCISRISCRNIMIFLPYRLLPTFSSHRPSFFVFVLQWHSTSLVHSHRLNIRLSKEFNN